MLIGESVGWREKEYIGTLYACLHLFSAFVQFFCKPKTVLKNKVYYLFFFKKESTGTIEICNQNCSLSRLIIQDLRENLMLCHLSSFSCSEPVKWSRKATLCVTFLSGIFVFPRGAGIAVEGVSLSIQPLAVAEITFRFRITT